MHEEKQAGSTIEQRLTNPEACRYTEISRKGYMAVLHSIMLPSDVDAVMAAYQIAKYGHGYRQQKRDDGRRYFDHARETSLIMALELGIRDWRYHALGLLHDVDEDTYVFTPWIRERLFPEIIGDLRLLTMNLDASYALLCHLGNPRVWMVKLCDRLHNCRTLDACTIEKQRGYVTETRECYLPLAERLHAVLPTDEQWRAVALRQKIGLALDRVEQALQAAG